jgi:hypothetical protein
MRNPRYALLSFQTPGDSLQNGVSGIPSRFASFDGMELATRFFNPSDIAEIETPAPDDPDKSILDKVKGIDIADPLGLGKKFNDWQEMIWKRSVVGLVGLAFLIIGIYVMAK